MILGATVGMQISILRAKLCLIVIVTNRLFCFFLSVLRFGTNSPPPVVHSQSHFANSGNSATTPENTEFNPTAAYLWLLSQQQQHLPNAAAAAAALNLTSRNAANSVFLNGNSANNGSPILSTKSHSPTANVHSNKDVVLDNEKTSNANPTKEKSKNHPVVANDEHKISNGTVSNGISQVNSSFSSRKRSKNEEEEDADDSTDDEDEDDDVESNNSSNAENPVSSTGFNGKISWTLLMLNILTNYSKA